jgi:hypothetical protein
LKLTPAAQKAGPTLRLEMPYSAGQREKDRSKEIDRSIILALNCHLLTGLMIQVNFFFPFLFQQLIAGLALLNFVGGDDSFLSAGDGLSTLDRRGGRRASRRSLDDCAGVVNVNYLIAGIASHRDGVDPIRVTDNSDHPSRPLNVSFAHYCRLHSLRQGRELYVISSGSGIKKGTCGDQQYW